MRRRLVLALIGGVSIACGFVACGIDEHGELQDGGGADATSNDAPPDVPLDVPIDVPQACKTLDATACIDAAVPDGWTLAVITAGNQLCPTTVDYDKTSFLTNLAPQSLCNCGCTVSGAVDCSGTIEAGSGGSCADNARWVFFDAGNTSACINTNWGDHHYSVPGPPTSTANVHCDASAPPPGWTASIETSCTPKCTADFCNVGSTYKRCIITNQTLSCPSPFTVPQPSLGIDAGVVTSCTGCGCSVTTTAKCQAVIQPFNSGSCNNPVDDASIANGTCPQTAGGSGNEVNSFSYAPIVPEAGCTAGGGTPSAQFATSVTVCCLP